MEKLKGKYEVILGFVTLIVSLSAFKDELAKIQLDLGYWQITLADYFLYSIYGFAICLYLYIVEHIARDTKIGIWKIFDYIIAAAFGIFALILTTPVLLIINIIVVKTYVVLHPHIRFDRKVFYEWLAVVTGILQIVLAVLTSIKLQKARRQNVQEEITEKEIIELENASKLFEDGYYSHSLLESFKVLETHLHKRLLQKGYRVSRNISNLITLALKEGIITSDDLPTIDDLRAMRNIAAHDDSNHTKQEAQFALSFVKKLLKRDVK